MKKVAAAALLFMGMAGLSAKANDSTAELSTGGLVFVRNENVEMRAEDLFISAAEIRVRYRFFNRSDKDVTVHVAFPMPEVTREDTSNIAIPSDDPVNLLGRCVVRRGAVNRAHRADHRGREGWRIRRRGPARVLRVRLCTR